MNLWRPIDWIGYLLAKFWTPPWQIRTGVLMILGIFVMSALALLFGGASLVITAVLALHESDDDDVEDLHG